jgi:predicted alpha/beta hydrolase family esterase
MNTIKVILIPGNGGGTPEDNWFPYLEHELPKLGITVINKQFPDPVLAREEFWIPFIKELGADENTILIGHSSGAIAALRFAEKNKILGTVLVGAYYTDLGDESEKKSGYFNNPWDWKSIKNNQKFIIQFASIDDPFIPVEEPRILHKNLDTEYHEYKDKKHFGHGLVPKLEFPELIEFLKQKLV